MSAQPRKGPRAPNLRELLAYADFSSGMAWVDVARKHGVDAGTVREWVAKVRDWGQLQSLRGRGSR